MKPRYCMGIDVGSYESKGVLIDFSGALVAYHAQTHVMENPQDGWFEHDAEAVWWNDFVLISRALLQKSGLRAEDIACVGASTLGSDCLPVDEDCKPLRKAILYGIDSRAQEEITYLQNLYGPEQEQTLFGRPICTGDVAPKILWLKNHESEIHKNAYKFLTGSSYLTAKLTGEFVMDRYLAGASFRPLYTEDGMVHAGRASLFCNAEQLPRTATVTQIAGYVTSRAAQECGLKEGTPVITGTGDSTAEAISTGVLAAGDAMLQFGSSLFLYCCTDRLVCDPRVRGNQFTVPGTYSIAAGTNAAGTLTRWYRDQLYPDIPQDAGNEAFGRMAQAVDQLPPGADGLITLPYFAGERTPINDPNAKGMLFGLKLSHTRAHLYRSALEGVGFSAAQHFDIFQELGVLPHRVMAVGGGTKNRPWMQIVADILGLPLHIAKVSIGAAYGDALMAGIGAGFFKDFIALRDVIEVAATVLPDPLRHAQYKKYRDIYDELYLATKSLMHQL